MGYPSSPFAVIDVPGVLLKNQLARGEQRPRSGEWASARANPHGTAATRIYKETSMEFNKEFDASVLACPLPIVKTKKALADMASGQILRVVATDPGSVCDMAAFAEQTGNALLEQGSENSKFIFYLKKA
jgi:tRNA 2-thiouridine synthesizing protein A